jgi:hypothetical protein
MCYYGQKCQFAKEAFALLTHLTDTLTLLITNLYISTGLLGIALAMAIESCCIPLPSEIVMPLAGIMIASGKILSGISTPLSLLFVAPPGPLVVFSDRWQPMLLAIKVAAHLC